MKLLFKQARKLGKTTYSIGEHEVPDSYASHWYFLALKANKDIVILEKPSAKVGQTDAQASAPSEAPKDQTSSDSSAAPEASIIKAKVPSTPNLKK